MSTKDRKFSSKNCFYKIDFDKLERFIFCILKIAIVNIKKLPTEDRKLKFKSCFHKIAS